MTCERSRTLRRATCPAFASAELRTFESKQDLRSSVAMSAVTITAINVLDNPQPVNNPLQFEIHYECLTDLEDDLQWKLIYVGSAESEEHDQMLDDVHVGPVVAGKFKFVLQAPAPDFKLIPKSDIVGVTVVLLTCSYKETEFLRVGYYAQTEYTDDGLRENPPDTPLIDRLQRRVIADAPRVTRFQCRFDGPESEDEEQPSEAPEAEDDLVINGDDDAQEQENDAGNRMADDEEDEGDEEEAVEDDGDGKAA